MLGHNKNGSCELAFSYFRKIVLISTIIILLAAKIPSPTFSSLLFLYAHGQSANGARDINAKPGIDLNGPYWDKDHIPVYVIPDNNTQGQSQKYLSMVHNAIGEMSDNLKNASGNRNTWNFDTKEAPKDIIDDVNNENIDKLPKGAIYIKLSSNPSDPDCQHGVEGDSRMGKDKAFTKICTANTQDSPIYDTIQHEVGHDLGLGHSNMPGDEMCSSDTLAGANNFDFLTCPGNNPDTKLSKLDYAGILSIYGKKGFDGGNPNFGPTRYEYGMPIDTDNPTFIQQSTG